MHLVIGAPQDTISRLKYLFLFVISKIKNRLRRNVINTDINRYYERYTKALEERQVPLFIGAELSKPTGFVDYQERLQSRPLLEILSGETAFS
jgi:hypothetical protein